MRKQLYGLITAFILMPVYAADDQRYNEMEAKGIFGKIKFNMIVSCYTKKKSTSDPINLVDLKKQYPDRVAACTCFEEELVKTSNRQIYNDSRKAYQLSQAKAKATQDNDTVRLIQLSEEEKKFRPFMAVIVEKCGLNK